MERTVAPQRALGLQTVGPNLMLQGLRMLVSICITALVVPAVLLMLLTVLITHGYTMAVPQGQNAMGLALPFLALIAAGIALLLATLLTFSQGSPWWIASAFPTPRLIAAAIALGIGMASVCTLVGWMERWGSWVPPASLITAILGPALMGAVLVVGAWKPHDQLRTAAWYPALTPALGVIALCGYAMTAAALRNEWNHAQANRERVAAYESREAEEQARRRSLTPVEALAEEFAQMSEQAPLWVFIARLPDEPDQARRAMTIERALRVPELSFQVSSTLSDSHPRYRHGTMELILALPPESLQSEWITSLKEAITLSASQIAANPDWMTPDPFSNPDPIRHIRCMALTARALHAQDSLADALCSLRDAIAAAATHPRSAACLKALDDARTTAP